MTQMCLADFFPTGLWLEASTTPVDTNLPQTLGVAGTPAKIGPKFQSNISRNTLKIQLGGMDMAGPRARSCSRGQDNHLATNIFQEEKQ